LYYFPHIYHLLVNKDDYIIWPLHRAISKHVLYALLCIQLHYHTILLSLTVRLNLLDCDDTIFIRNSLNRFVMLRTACMTSSHLNMTLLSAAASYSLPHPSGPNETVILLLH